MKIYGFYFLFIVTLSKSVCQSVFSHRLHGSQVLFILYVSWRNQINDVSLARESFC